MNTPPLAVCTPLRKFTPAANPRFTIGEEHQQNESDDKTNDDEHGSPLGTIKSGGRIEQV
ncbi:hypothetical protein [Thalassococcus lentus]|uniref:Uncharacterized protein n=1 Tax=Thalassococcus lentus TaxID=1210524 RepID=A0ABT4XWW7_9RHOB|nr:hypothetical protein [Thalassococcus lentus]MDA7426456.1 hypothetical protein [Thalassococcus lentus]